MSRPAIRFGASAAFALGLAVVAAAQTSSPQQPVFHAGVNLVTVDAYPRKDGKIVEGLTPADFQVLEDGKPQKIETFEFIRVEPSTTTELSDPNNQREMLQRAADPHNRVFVAYLDSSFVTITGAHDIRQPLIDFFDKALAPNDLFGVLTDINSVGSLVLQRRTGSIDSQLTENWPWGERERIDTNPHDSEERAMFDCFGGSSPLLAELIQRLREERTLQHLSDLINRLGAAREARSIIVLVSDGWLLFKPNQTLVEDVSRYVLSTADGRTPMPPITIMNGQPGIGKFPAGFHDQSVCSTKAMHLAQLDDEPVFHSLLQLANQKNVSFYPINPDGLRVFDESPASTGTSLSAGENINRVRVRSDVSRTLAENTDGVAIVETNDLRAGMKRLIDDVSAYYLLGYYSTNPKFDGKFRQIKVSVNQPKVEISARRGYVAPTEAEIAAKTKAAAKAADPPAVPGLDSAMNALGRLDSDADVFTHARVEDDDLAVSIELSSRQMGSGAWSKGGTVRVAVSGVEAPVTVPIAAGTRGAVAHVPVGLSGGPFTITITVTGGDTLTDRLTVARNSAATLGAPLVSRGGAAAASPLRPCADFQFSRTERVHVEVPEHAILAQRTARVLSRSGAPMPFDVAVTEHDVNGIPTLIADLTLAPFAPGDYAIDISGAAGSAAPEHVIVPIRVAR